MEKEYSMGTQKKRINYIDVAKGFGIICIVFGHVMKSSFLRQVIFAFHVPFFFLLSGMTYQCKQDKKQFYLDKFTRLLIPYYSFSLISIAIYTVMIRIGWIEGDGRLVPNLLGMLYANSNSGYMEWNKPLWFLPCLLAVYGIVDVFETAICKRIQKRRMLMRTAYIVVLWTAGIIVNTCYKGIWLPFHLESAIYLAGFTELGCQLKEFGPERIADMACGKNRWMGNGVLILCLLAGCGISFFNGVCEVRGQKFGSYPILFLISALILSAAFLLLSVRTEKCRILQKIGMSSLSILLLHKFPVIVFQKIPLLEKWICEGNSLAGLIGGVFITLIVVFLCMVGEYVIEHIVPAVLGKKKANP